MANLAFHVQLKDGIFFESSRELLKWGCTRAEAWQVKGASQYLPDGDTRIQWEDNLFGLRCGILAYLPDNTILDHVYIWMRLPENTYPNSALYQYCKFFDHLFRDYGTPHIQASGGLYAPLLTWERHGCRIQLSTGERHGEYTTVEIRHNK
jgi:hypothetical protein